MSDSRIEKNINAFHAIKAFVGDLVLGFASKKNPKSPLGYYSRLIDSIQDNNYESVMKVLGGFSTFFRQYGKYVIDNNFDSMPKGTVIPFGQSQTIFIEIQKFIHKADDEAQDIIRQHLLAIHSLMSSKTTADLVEKVDNTEEMICGLVEKAQKVMKDVDMNDKMAVIASLAESGLITDLIDGVQNNMEGADPAKMMSALQKAAKKFIAPEDAAAAGFNIDEITRSVCEQYAVDTAIDEDAIRKEAMAKVDAEIARMKAARGQ